MGEAEIYVTFGKADVKTGNCLRCRRVIKRDDELWKLSSLDLFVGSMCRRDECQKEENIREAINGAARASGISSGVEAAVRQVIEHYGKPGR